MKGPAMFSLSVVGFVLMFVSITVMQFLYRRAQAQLSPSQRLIAFENQSNTSNTIIFGALLTLLLLLWFFFTASGTLVKWAPVFLGLLIVAVALTYWFQYKRFRRAGLPESYCKSIARAYL